jgi:NhaP-type Na+/H+ or K+/H+ antiporter
MGTSLILALIALTALACQWLAWRSNLPAILFLLLAGLFAGPVSGVLVPDAMFGELLFPLVSVCVAIILFEGSLTLDLAEIRSQRTVVRRLITLGALVTWILVACASRWLFALDWSLAVLFGALTVVTGPTVIAPMLRTVRPKAELGKILRWEGILIDPIGALLVVVVYEFITAQNQATSVALTFIKVLVSGTSLGLLAGWLTGIALARRWLPEYLQNLAVLAAVLLAFSVANYLAHESGLLAVTLMGMWLANQKHLRLAEILHFKEDLSLLLISGLFILLAARLDLAEVTQLGWAPLILLALMQFVARPLTIWVSAFGSDLSWKDKALLAWIAPRGIVAAAVSALFAIKLQQQGAEGAAMLVPLMFCVIFGTVIFQSATARPVARWLGVVEPPPDGILILGANPVACAIAKELARQNIQVLLADSVYDNVRRARMAGLPIFYGSPMSDYASSRLPLTGLGKLMALSTDNHLNTIACMHFRDEFGLDRVFALHSRILAHKEISSSKRRHKTKHYSGEDQRGLPLFDADLSYSQFINLLAKGARLKTTRLSQRFTYEDFKANHADRSHVLLAITPEGKVRMKLAGKTLRPKPGWRIVSLCLPPSEPATMA